jgi:hypothetical protein
MQIVQVKPINNGKKTELTIEMSADEAHLFAQALAEGKLAHLGISGASVTESNEADRDATPWVKAERDKRSTPKDAPKPKRR